MITGLLWDDNNEAHIARHEVTPAEVEEVVFGGATRFFEDDAHRPGRLVAFGVTDGGRWLVVVLDKPTSAGDAYVVTARPQSSRERRDFFAYLGSELADITGGLEARLDEIADDTTEDEDDG